MAEVKLPFGERTDTGQMVSIEAVMRGLACDCVCPACRTPLVAAKGEIVRHHFRHLAENRACREARETALHLFAKQIICETLNLQLPEDLGPMRSAVAEAAVAGLRYDVLATYDEEDVAIEIFVAHRVPLEKVEKLVEAEVTALEIDLSSFRDADLDETDWREAVLVKAPRRWLNAPAFVRRALAIRVEQMKEEERRAYEVARLARIAREKAREAWLIEQEEERAEIARQEAENAERRRKDAEVAHALKELEDAQKREREIQRQPPKLIDLVRAHGGYDKITPEAWARWDADTKLYKERVATGYFYNKIGRG